MPKSFYIIDGHAHIYRAYFAPFRELTSPSGEPTKATYVFTQMLLSLIKQRKPDYLAMAIDAGDETVFRKQILPEYKANRQKRPDDFGPQEQRILRIVADAGVPIFCKGGYEADDLIATMVRKLSAEGFDEVIMVSKDKDLRQLLNHCTKMYDVQGDRFIDSATIERDCGFTPAQAVEVQALTGDPTDNVPGIPGVGEKTAAKLVQKYGSIEAIFQHLDELTPKLRDNLQQHADVLPISRQLVKLKDDVEFDFEAEACRFQGLDLDALARHLKELGFHSMLERLSEQTEIKQAPPRAKRFDESLFGSAADVGERLAPEPSTCDGCDYRLIDSEDALTQFVAELKKQKRFAFDTETDALNPMQANLIGMSFSWKHATGYYVPVRGPSGSQHLAPQRVLKDLQPILENPKIKKVGHNLKYDLLIMRGAGVRARGITTDSMIAAFLLDSGRMQFGIDRLALDLLNYRKIATVELIGKGRNQLSMDRVDLQRVATYASEDADIALRLADLFEQRLSELPALRKLHDELETPLIDVLVEMESNGIAIDPAILKEQSDVLGRRIEELREQIYAAAGGEFNLDSPRQLGEILFNKLKLRVVKRTKTGPSTDVEVLEKLADEHAVPRLILEYRSLVKLKNTYLDNLTAFVNARTGRIHANFNQLGAATGRLSCNDPNLQNIPIRTDEGRRIRLAFVPGDRQKHVLLTADYSQIELRILAHFTDEPRLVEAFARDEDVHAAVAAEVFNVPLDQVTRDQRGQAKTINFGIIYGVSAYGLARRIDNLSVAAAQDFIDAYAKRFPSIQQFIQKCVMEAQAKGYVGTILGRRRPIPDIASGVLALRNAAERMAINSVVQGSAADLIKSAMINIHRRLMKDHRPSKLLLQVHDELVFETPANAVESEAEMIRHEMTTAMKLKVPLKVEIGWGKNWQEVK